MLPRVVGHAHAMDILLSGRKLDAHEALRLGLVSAVYDNADLVDRVREYAVDIAVNCSPRSLATIKNQVLVDATRGFADALATAEELTFEAHGWADSREGWQSYVERRAPRFPPLIR
jgi:enoyl-CoA hydratase/carnithine racemase